MKKIIIVLFLLIAIPTISSAEFEFLKDSDIFDQGETIIARVSGNFVDQITRENVLFYEDHVRIPMVYDVKRIENDFYIYAQLIDKPEGNYSVIIEGVRYMLGTQTTDEEIVVPFTITNNTADFYVTPGIIITKEDFDLEIQNLRPIRTTVSIESSNLIDSESSLELVSGEIKKINFQRTSDSQFPESFFDEVTLSSENTIYTVPILLEPFDEGVDEDEETEKVRDLKFEPGSASVSMATDSDSKRIIYIINTGEDLIENISLSVSSSLEKYVNISPTNIGMLNEGSVQRVEIFINSGEEELELEGSIIATSEGIATSFTFSLDFVRDFIPEDEEDEETDKRIITTCEQLGGSICGDDEKCTGETISAKDGTCCLEPGVCEEIQESNTGRIIGWSIVILVIILLAWFFLKYKKARPRADILSIGKKK